MTALEKAEIHGKCRICCIPAETRRLKGNLSTGYIYACNDCLDREQKGHGTAAPASGFFWNGYYMVENYQPQ